MKIACLGDIHGTDRWKEVRSLEWDYCVFIGDYVDSTTIATDRILDNLKEIIAFKRSKPEKVILLWGNHDIQYRFYPQYLCSGFRPEMLEPYQKLFVQFHDLFQVAWFSDDYLFTHAGLSQKWAGRQLIDKSADGKTWADWLNRNFENEKLRDAIAIVGHARGGLAEHGGPLWCDFGRELMQAPYPGINQVLGHSATTFLIIQKPANSLLINVDYLAYSNEKIFILDTDKNYEAASF